MNRKPLNLGSKSVSEKMDHIQGKKQQELIKTEILPPVVEISSPEIQKIMKEHKLKKEQIGIRFDLDNDLNMELDIICAKTRKNKKDFLLEWVSEGIRKEKRKFDK